MKKNSDPGSGNARIVICSVIKRRTCSKTDSGSLKNTYFNNFEI